MNFTYIRNKMSQAQETRCLSKKQIETTLKNWFKILGVKKSEILSQGKPVFSKENEDKWNLQHITKFADNYTLWKCTTDDKPLYFIVIETNKFDKLNISACCWYYHFFENEIDKKSVYPQVFICPAFVVTDTMFLHVPVNIIPCRYRFVSLCELYPMIGSSTELYGMSYNYRLIKNENGELEMPYNGRVYSIIYDKDPMVKLLNGLPSDVIEYSRVMFEGSPYGEKYRREIVSTMSDINVIAPSGLCLGYEK